jgi:hypothetical protein
LASDRLTTAELDLTVAGLRARASFLTLLSNDTRVESGERAVSKPQLLKPLDTAIGSTQLSCLGISGPTRRLSKVNVMSP